MNTWGTRGFVLASIVVASTGCFGAVADPVSEGPSGAAKDAPSAPAAPSTPTVPATPPVVPSGPPCNAVVGCERVVFVTSRAFSADLGGLSGADAKCTAAAAAATSPRVRGRGFVAWLSTEGSSAKDRLVHGSAPYVRPDGVVVAADWDGLVSGALGAPLAVDENGVTVGTETNAWTGTTPTGDYDAIPIMLAPSSCHAWSGETTELATIGRPTAIDQLWTSGGGGNCSPAVGFVASLYCVER